RLLPIILVLAVIRFGSAMAVIEEYIIMGGFDKTRSTYSWTVYMYDTAFGGGLQFRGYAAAIGWVGAFFMLIVVAGMFYLFRSLEWATGRGAKVASEERDREGAGRVDGWPYWHAESGGGRGLAPDAADQVGDDRPPRVPHRALPVGNPAAGLGPSPLDQ